jgi:membrane-associated HD superfamily phosphohydrolase
MGALALGIASFAVGAVQTVASYASAQQQAKQQTQQQIQNANASVDDWRNQQNQITQRRLQEQDALGQKLTQQNLDEAQAKAEVQTSAAASGVSGISVDNLMSDVTRRASANRQTEETNTDYILQQLSQQSKSVNSQSLSRINSVPNATKPSPLSLIAGIGSAGVNSYTNYQRAIRPMAS